MPKFSKGDHRSRKVWFTDDGIRILSETLSLIGKRFNCTSTKDFVHLAMKYSLSIDRNAAVFVGFKDKQQIEESLSTKGVLSAGEQRQLRLMIQDAKNQIRRLREK
jgi:hypothetical protein